MTGPAGDGTGVSSFKQHTGSHSYHFYVYGFNTHELWQTVSLPSSSSQVTLSYWLYQAKLYKTGSTCPAFYVKIRTASGTDITTIQNPCPANFTTNTWMQQSIDLTSALAPYAGQQVEVYFKTYAGAVSQYDYYLDDVTLGASPGTTTTTYTYNALNQQTNMSVSTGQNVAYTYDGVGNMLTKVDGGGQLTYTYTSVDQVQSVKDPSGATTTFQYDGDGQRSQIAYPNGVTETMGYNLSGQLTSIGAQHGSTTLTSFTYSYTNPSSGQPQSMPNSVTDASGNTTTYTYDQLNHLTQAVQKNSGGTQLHNYQYGFDHAGNMTSLVRDSQTITKTFNAPNELTQANTTTYSYDGNANRTGDSTGTSILYNTARQTTSITPSGGQAVTMAYSVPAGGAQSVDGGVLFQYDALGSSSAAQSGVTTYFTRASDGTLVSERPSSGGTYYYLTDGEGSVVALTDSSGTVVNQYTFEPTGKAVISNGSVWNPYQWHGMVWDPAVQEYSTGNGHYDPNAASCDTAGSGPGWPGQTCLPSNYDWQYLEQLRYIFELIAAEPGYDGSVFLAGESAVGRPCIPGWQCLHLSEQYCSIYGCWYAGFSVTVIVAYNGKSVKLIGPVSCDHSGFASTDWCGSTYPSGLDYVSAGGNFSVCVGLSIGGVSPKFCLDGGIRIDVGVEGAYNSWGWYSGVII
jgi:YD repeat-containing protein